jgi:hypothetical protein
MKEHSRFSNEDDSENDDNNGNSKSKDSLFMYKRTEQGDNRSQMKAREKLKTEQKQILQVKSVRDQSYSEEQDKVYIYDYIECVRTQDNRGSIMLPKGSVVISILNTGDG